MPQERLPWLEEVLVGKAELEERKSRTNELEQAVAELTMQTEYQLRLKDLHVQVGGAGGWGGCHLCMWVSEWVGGWVSGWVGGWVDAVLSVVGWIFEGVGGA
jgi:hypothetical protein